MPWPRRQIDQSPPHRWRADLECRHVYRSYVLRVLRPRILMRWPECCQQWQRSPIQITSLTDYRYRADAFVGYVVAPSEVSALMSAVMAGCWRNLSRQRRRVGPMLPTGMASRAPISA